MTGVHIMKFAFSRLIIVLMALMAISTAGFLHATERRQTQSGKTPVTSQYENWIRDYRTGRLSMGLGGDPKAQVILAITAIEGDDLKPDDKPSPLGPISRIVRHGCAVSADGKISTFYTSAGGAKGGGPSPLPDDEFRKLQQLITALPDDHSHLPPPGRRFILQAPAADHILARVYDRANAPEIVWEIVRSTACPIKPWLLTFDPVKEWPADYFQGANLQLAPDGLLVSAGKSAIGRFKTSFKFWNPENQLMVKEIPESGIPVRGGWANPTGMRHIVLSPDGATLVVEGSGQIDLLDPGTWQGLRRIGEPFIDRKRHALSNAQFTSDGRYLLVQSDEPALEVFDTKTWETVTSLPSLPENVVAYFSASNGDRAIYLSKSGELRLWDPLVKRDISTLDHAAGRVSRAAFSPDHSLVAVATVRPYGETKEYPIYHVRIWRASNGQLLHELLPLEQDRYLVGDLLWSPDGQFLLADARVQNPFFDSPAINVWSVASGRHRGEFEGCSFGVFGFALVSGANLVAAGCGDGKIRIWDAASAMENIRKFEASLATHE